jgi:hypothetical protein
MGTVYKGWNARLFLDDLEIACAESVSVDVATNMDSYYCIGSRFAYAVVPGNFEITGSIAHAWVNIYYLALMGITSIPPGTPAKFWMCFKASTDVGAPLVYLYNCMFEKGSLDIPQDGVLKESYDFRAESIWVGTVPA